VRFRGKGTKKKDLGVQNAAKPRTCQTGRDKEEGRNRTKKKARKGIPDGRGRGKRWCNRFKLKGPTRKIV